MYSLSRLLPRAGAVAFSSYTCTQCDNVRSDVSPAAVSLPKRPVAVPVPVEEDHHEYIKGIKIYGIGIKEDPVPGEKRGKGIQHLTSSFWIYDMGVFIQRNFTAMQIMAKYAFERSEDFKGGRAGFDFRYFINVSNALFLKAEAEGLRTRDGRDFFLMACWAAMAAAEVDGFQGGDDETATYRKYSEDERRAHRASFYQKYLNPHVVWDENEEDDPEIEAVLGRFAIECCRIDLLPTVAMERLGVHNELCAIKWKDPNAWMREGFAISSRFDSMKRHYEGVHSKDRSEDHLAHLIWGFMAINHVVAVFPHMNDLTNFEELRRHNVAMEARRDPALLTVVGDGGFRSGVPGRTRQSGSDPRKKLLSSQKREGGISSSSSSSNSSSSSPAEGGEADSGNASSTLMINRQWTARHGSFLFPPEQRKRSASDERKSV